MTRGVEVTGLTAAEVRAVQLGRVVPVPRSAVTCEPDYPGAYRELLAGRDAAMTAAIRQRLYEGDLFARS